MNFETISADLDNWKKTDVLKLASHFHKWCSKTHQHKRVYNFEMAPEYLAQFNGLDTIKLINICLAVKSVVNEGEFAFYPVLEIHLEASKPVVYLPLIGYEAPPNEVAPLSDIVPGIFKEMISKNWHNIQMSLVDDLFLAKKQSDGSFGAEMVRVHHFEIGERMIAHINAIRAVGPVDGVVLYPGVDMNKMADKHMISFTPILGIKHPEINSIHAQHGVIETIESETFIEYSSPCPPTCGRKTGSKDL